MTVRLAAVVLLALGLVGCAPPAAAPRNDSIREDDLRADLHFLASDALQGRLTNTPGNAAAAEFVRMRFARLGLQPAGSEGSYFHRYDLMTATLGARAPSNRLIALVSATSPSGVDVPCALM